MPRHALLKAGGALIALGVLLGAAPTARLDGQWRIDREASDAPERAIARAIRRIDDILLPNRHLPGRSPEAQARRRQAAGEALFEPLLLPEQSLEIISEPPRVVLVYDGERRRVVHTDARGSIVDSGGGGVHVAGFEGDALVIETASNRGTRIIERFIAAGDDRLRLKVEVQNSLFEDPVRFRLVFTPARAL